METIIKRISAVTKKKKINNELDKKVLVKQSIHCELMSNIKYNVKP